MFLQFLSELACGSSGCAEAPIGIRRSTTMNPLGHFRTYVPEKTLLQSCHS
jgi:hypothetical protein